MFEVGEWGENRPILVSISPLTTIERERKRKDEIPINAIRSRQERGEKSGNPIYAEWKINPEENPNANMIDSTGKEALSIPEIT